MAPKRRGENGSIYSYETRDGRRRRFVFRDSRGRQSSRSGFTSRREAQRERQRVLGKVHRGEVRAAREDLAGFWERYLHARRPYLESGSWQDYRRNGSAHPPAPRAPPVHVAHSAGLRDWLVRVVAGSRSPQAGIPQGSPRGRSWSGTSASRQCG
jgi:hypothetical protein